MPLNFEDWMSDGDAVMWHIERDPVLRSTITSVWVLDRSPDPKRFDDAFNRAIEKIPRLTQRVIADPLGVSPPRWEHDPLFDRDYHVRRLRAPGNGTIQDLFAIMAPYSFPSTVKTKGIGFSPGSNRNEPAQRIASIGSPPALG